MSGPAAMVEATLADPSRLLGFVERNVEAKLIAPVLELLGWDLATQVLWGPQIRRVGPDGQRRDVEADVFIADIATGQLRFMIEAKRWDRPLDAATIAQAQAYLADVAAQRALVTNGRRWIVIDAGVDEPVATHTAVAGRCAELVAALAPHLSPDTSPASALPPTRTTPAAVADLDELADTDPLIAQLLAGIRALANEHAANVYLEPGPKGLVLRLQRTRRVLVPINSSDPLRPELYRSELEALNVGGVILDRYVAALRALPDLRTPEAVSAFVVALGAIASSS